MALNIQELTTELSVHGDVVSCEVTSETYLLVIMDNVTASHGLISEILSNCCSAYYPNVTSSTLLNGLFKSELSE